MQTQTLTVFFTFAIPVLALCAQLFYKDSLNNNKEVANGPIIPLSLPWYLLSNYLCANAVYLYPKSTPLFVRLICWIGLMGGGIDHIIETYHWFVGTPTGFGMHWLNNPGYEVIPMVGFGLTSIVGIGCFIVEWALYDKSASKRDKGVIIFCFICSMVYELVNSFFLTHASVNWHVGHMFVTHIGLSMIPPIICFTYIDDIDLFTAQHFRDGNKEKAKMK